MFLSPSEQEKLLIYVAAEVAAKRRARGLLLNYPEAVALITVAMIEGARDGLGLADCVLLGQQVIGADEVLPEVPELIDVVQVEATFEDGTKLISCHHPVKPGVRKKGA